MITIKKYEAPRLTVHDYAADTMISSNGGSGGGPKNDNPDNNQNCWGCNSVFGLIVGENVCLGPNTPGC